LSTASKDFKIKNGLIVQGSSATVAGNQVLTTNSNIEDLSNVNTTGVSDGDTLVYNTTTQTWLAAAGGSGGATYSISAETVTGGANLRLTGSDASTDDVKIEGSGLVTITRTDANTINVDANLDLTFNQQTASYTIVLADKNKMIEVDSASANDIIIPLDSTTNFPVGAQVNVLQTGAGQTSIAATSGVTLVGTPGLKLREQWSAATLIKRAANSWVVIGDLSE
jgi:hypothetical protein